MSAEPGAHVRASLWKGSCFGDVLGCVGPCSTVSLMPLAWDDGTTRMAWQGWQDGSMARQGRHSMEGWVQAACTQHLSARLPSPARPLPLPCGTDGFNTFLGLFSSIINSCLQVGRHFFPFGRAITLSSAVCFFKAIAYLSPNRSLLFLLGSFMALGCPPFFFPPLLLPGGKIRRDCRRRRPQLREGS